MNETFDDAMREQEAVTLPVTPPLRKTGALSDGVRLPGHAVGDLLGRGGMGAVYRARQAAIERDVAVKVMTLDAREPETAERFRREAHVLGRLAHPNIVPIHEMGVDADGRPFYTMKLVKGRTLRAILAALRDGDPATTREHTLSSLLTVFRKVCDAMAFAHSEGLLHRDLKPENVMVGEFGEVLVMDWGLAKVMRSHQSSVVTDQPKPVPDANGDHLSLNTLQGSVMGTPQFMSPEQARGEIDVLDERSDIFSLGGMLYAILTLRPPVEGKSLDEVLTKVRRAAITPIQGYGTNSPRISKNSERGHPVSLRVPPALVAVVMKALSLQPAARYQSVAELAQDIAAYQGGFATRAEKAGTLRQVALLVRRHKAVSAALVVLLVASVVFVLRVMASERKAARNEQIARTNEQTALREKEATRRALAKSSLALADASLRQGDGVAMHGVLESVPSDLRDHEWSYLLGRADTTLAHFRIGSGCSSAAPHSLRAGVFALAGFRGEVALVDVRSGKRELEFTAGFSQEVSHDSFAKVAVSPDGETIAIGRRDAGGDIVLHSARDGRKLREWRAGNTQTLAFSPDGQRLLQSGVGNGQFTVWDVASGRELWRYRPRAGGDFTHGAFTPDGAHVVTVGWGDPMRVVAAATGETVRSWPAKHDFISALVVLADGTAVTGDQQGYVSRHDLASGQVISEWRAATGSPLLAAAEDGSRVVAAGAHTDRRHAVQVWTLGAEVPHALLGSHGFLREIAVHPLSGELVLCALEAFVWDVAGAREAHVLRTNRGVVQTSFWGTDDLLFAPDGESGTVLLDLATEGKPAVRWHPKTTNLHHHSVSADGQLAALNRYSESRLELFRMKDGVVERAGGFDTEQMAHTIALDPHGARVAFIGSKRMELQVFDTATGQPAVTLEFGGMKWFGDVDWAVAGTRIVALATDGAGRGEPDSREFVGVWDAASGKLLHSMVHPAALEAVSVAPDGLRLAEGGGDKCVRIRDVEMLAVQREFRAHDDTITAIAWHPSKPQLATAATDSTVRLWDLATGRMLREFRTPQGVPSGLAFSPGGKRLACAVKNDAVRVWEIGE